MRDAAGSSARVAMGTPWCVFADGERAGDEPAKSRRTARLQDDSLCTEEWLTCGKCAVSNTCLTSHRPGGTPCGHAQR